jgi:integrase
MLIGVYTGLRCDTLSQLEWRHVKMNEAQVEIFVDYESKTDQMATGMWFALPKAADDPQLDAYVLFSKYKTILEKKNKKLTTGRLWIRIDEHKDRSYSVTAQVRGKDWVAEVPKKVATWLCLPEAEKYTGHSFRRTCAQWGADAGMSETQMQHHFGWKSASMIVRYSRNSDYLKQTAAAKLDMESRESGANAKVSKQGKQKTKMIG